MYDHFINIICIISLLYILYQSYIEYKKDLEFKQTYITNHDDLEDKLAECNNSNLYNMYQNLSEDDKKFLEIYINYARIKQKNNMPKYSKLYNGIKNQILFSCILSLILKRNPSSLFSLLKQNTLQQFGTQFL